MKHFNIFASMMGIALVGCGILIGNVKPVEEKSESYGILDLSQKNPEWARITAANPDARAQLESNEGSPSDVSDVAYQSKLTASIISLNSSCRPSIEKEAKDLRAFTDLLFLGISNIKRREERTVTLQGTPALETTIQGVMNNEDMMLRTVVMKRGSCIYDLMYVARPDRFQQNEADFSQFVASLSVK